MLLIHDINSAISLVLASSLNILLIYLILRRSKKEMKVYSKILLLTCTVDFCIAWVHFIVQPFGSSITHYRFVVQTGSFGRYFSNQYFNGEEFWICSAYMFLLFFAPTTLTVQFIYRYVVICKRIAMSSGTFIGLLLILSSWSFASCYMYYLLGYPPFTNNGSEEQKILYAELSKFLGEKHTKICIFMDGNSNLWTFLNVFEAVCSTLLYATIAFSIYKIRTFKSQYGNEVSKQSSADRQISITLSLQAILPLIILMIPNGVNFLIFLTNTSALKITVYLTLPFPWIPIVNPLITIVVVKSYRAVVLKAFYHVLSPIHKFSYSGQNSVNIISTIYTTKPMQNDYCSKIDATEHVLM